MSEDRAFVLHLFKREGEDTLIPIGGEFEFEFMRQNPDYKWVETLAVKEIKDVQRSTVQ